MADNVRKGEEFEKKAEKKINGWGLFGSKYDDAAELYAKSANHFKLAKSCMFFCFSLAHNRIAQTSTLLLVSLVFL